MRSCALAVTLVLALVPTLLAQDKGIRGNWRTPGGAVVHIAPCGTEANAFCATLLQLEPGVTTRVDEMNPDAAQKSRRLCGLQIGYGFQLTDPAHAEDGHLYDPKSGKTYKGAMSSNGDTLDLRGYVGIKLFGRTERWTRTSDSVPTCS